MGVEPKIGDFVKPPKIIRILIGFSIIKFIHFGFFPLFLETPIWSWEPHQLSWSAMIGDGWFWLIMVGDDWLGVVEWSVNQISGFRWLIGDYWCLQRLLVRGKSPNWVTEVHGKLKNADLRFRDGTQTQCVYICIIYTYIYIYIWYAGSIILPILGFLWVSGWQPIKIVMYSNLSTLPKTNIVPENGPPQ